MTDPALRALLPTGLRDLLPPDAAHEAAMVERLIAFFAGWGYERVKPPLVEFEDNLLSGAGRAMASQTFRIMDPISQRMMGLRADMTLQVARIAAHRLVNAPRPLRLCYSGQVLRVKGSQLQPQRQFAQVGVELIGAPPHAADAEAVLMAASSLREVGAEGVTVDLTLPTLVASVLDGMGVAQDLQEILREALDHKDAAVVAQVGGAAGPVLTALLDAAGPAARAMEKLKVLTLPEAASVQRDHLASVLEILRREAPDLSLTVDPVENRGFHYHTGLSFTIFSRGRSGELGRGGRYEPDSGEPATGFTLFMDMVIEALPAPERPKRLFLPFGTAGSVARRLRGEGWVTVAGLGAVADLSAEARRLECGHVFEAGQVRTLE
jgi:ATP phosphoribosyltransferase regulatory subunit